MNHTIKTLQAGHNAIVICSDTLEKIAGTCCMPGRSNEMNQSLGLLDELATCFKQSDADPDALQTAVGQIETVGALIGKLNVTCCTDIRVPLYQQLFKQLNFAHGKLSEAMGLSH